METGGKLETREGRKEDKHWMSRLRVSPSPRKKSMFYHTTTHNSIEAFDLYILSTHFMTFT